VEIGETDALHACFRRGDGTVKIRSVLIAGFFHVKSAQIFHPVLSGAVFSGITFRTNTSTVHTTSSVGTFQFLAGIGIAASENDQKQKQKSGTKSGKMRAHKSHFESGISETGYTQSNILKGEGF
jgi:hypothetical protein